MGFSMQEYWSGLPCPSLGDLPNPGIEPRSPALQKILYQLSYQGRPVVIMWSESCSVVSYTLWPHGLYSLWNCLGQNTRVGSLSLLQGIFPTQGSNPGLLDCGQILYHLSHQRRPGSTISILTVFLNCNHTSLPLYCHGAVMGQLHGMKEREGLTSISQTSIIYKSFYHDLYQSHTLLVQLFNCIIL